jgi:hypothetical protein
MAALMGGFSVVGRVDAEILTRRVEGAQDDKWRV